MTLWGPILAAVFRRSGAHIGSPTASGIPLPEASAWGRAVWGGGRCGRWPMMSPGGVSGRYARPA
eukprot:3473375-Prymnesium_polylepis.1